MDARIPLLGGCGGDNRLEAKNEMNTTPHHDMHRTGTVKLTGDLIQQADGYALLALPWLPVSARDHQPVRLAVLSLLH